MIPWDIVKIIALILYYIAKGKTREQAVKLASKKFGVSEKNIWKFGGRF
jgi:hypothetical protein